MWYCAPIEFVGLKEEEIEEICQSKQQSLRYPGFYSKVNI